MAVEQVTPLARAALPDGRVLKTLHRSRHYVAALPKAAQERAEWQTAAEMLIAAAKGQSPS
jgi:hypothetical protein